jgi:hypothetical protein
MSPPSRQRSFRLQADLLDDLLPERAAAPIRGARFFCPRAWTA